MYSTRRFFLSLLAAIVTLTPMSLSFADPPPAIDPSALLFRRQAVQRFVFNNNLPLCKVDMPGAFDLPLMHPSSAENVGAEVAKVAIKDAHLIVSNASATASTASAMFIGGVNPYATYDVEVDARPDSGAVGIELASGDRVMRLAVLIRFGGNDIGAVVLERHAGSTGDSVPTRLGSAGDLRTPFTLRVQLFGTKLNAYVVQGGMTRFVGGADLLPDFNLRTRSVFGAMHFNLLTRLEPGGALTISRVESYLSCGMGQADIRLITYEDGAPLITENRLWFTLSLRGTAGGILSTQGVFSLDPSIFDPRLEGMIVYDRGDGELRNDYASHIFYDSRAREWRGWAVGFSAQNDHSAAAVGILSVHSTKDPRRGFSVMSAAPLDLPHKSEDPNGVWDADAKRWRLLVTSFEKSGLRAVMYESKNWNGPYQRLAGPVAEDSTGTLIQKIGASRYVLAGSADKSLYVYSYPDLKMHGALQLELPPFDAIHNGRVWPNVVPLPEGYPSRYVALMMDRVNFPGIEGANWTYGALYFYRADAPFPATTEWYEYGAHTAP